MPPGGGSHRLGLGFCSCRRHGLSSSFAFSHSAFLLTATFWCSSLVSLVLAAVSMLWYLCTRYSLSRMLAAVIFLNEVPLNSRSPIILGPTRCLSMVEEPADTGALVAGRRLILTRIPPPYVAGCNEVKYRRFSFARSRERSADGENDISRFGELSRLANSIRDPLTNARTMMRLDSNRTRQDVLQCSNIVRTISLKTLNYPDKASPYAYVNFIG